MTLKEWIAPGLILTIVSGGASFAGGYAVDRHRLDAAEKNQMEFKAEIKELIRDSNRETQRQISELANRVAGMERDGKSVARLEAQIENLNARISEIKGEVREYEGRSAARYDNLNSRISRMNL